MKRLIIILTIYISVTPFFVAAHDIPTTQHYPDNDGELIDQNTGWYKECLRVKDVQPPKGDMLPAQLIGAMANCDEEEMYYDTQADSTASNEDWAKVRACAFQNKDNTVLMMLYANGFGVEVNLDLAIKYSCSGPRGESEMEEQVADLMARKTRNGGTGINFDQCNYAAGTVDSNRCTVLEERQKDRERNYVFDAIKRKLSPDQIKEFDKLRKAVSKFADARGVDEYEAHILGTIRTSESIYATSHENELFMYDIKQYEKGIYPVYTQKQLSDLDTQLNQVYRKIFQSNNVQTEQVTANSVDSNRRLRETQRIWLKYRDAWVEFGHVRYPSVPSYVWKALYTERRVEQLQNYDE